MRERREDVPLLVDHFFKRHIARQSLEVAVGGRVPAASSVVRAIAPEVIAALTEDPWPGNVRQLENVIERMVVTARREVAQIHDLSTEVRAPGPLGPRPRRERRRTVADDLFKKLTENGESFCKRRLSALHEPGDYTCQRARPCAQRARGGRVATTKIVLRLFNMSSGDYKRFLNFLRKHDCQLPFKEYR